jgi:hypothetical protein
MCIFVELQLTNTKPNSPWWNNDITEVQLRKYSKCIENDPSLSKLVKYWGKERNKPIKTLHELILCYYSGIKIICIPHMTSPSAAPLLLAQYQKLRAEISEAVVQTKKMRIEAELLMNSEELNIYLGDAFNHFSTDATQPFNFLSAAVAHNPVRTTFKTHIINTALRLMETNSFDAGWKVFVELAPLIASTILLDVCRKEYPQKCTLNSHLDRWHSKALI